MHKNFRWHHLGYFGKRKMN